MFTGIIQTMGRIEGRRASGRGVTFAVAASDLSGKLAPGDSVSINGACHTVESIDGKRFEVTSVSETLTRTTLGAATIGDTVNLECSATPTTALSGHIVQGHIDGVGRVVRVSPDEDNWMLTLEVPRVVHEVVVPKGSIAIDGVSLTVVDSPDDSTVTIAIVPYTLGHTIIGRYKAGTEVNVEADIIGKYVKKVVGSGVQSVRPRQEPRSDES